MLQYFLSPKTIKRPPHNGTITSDFSEVLGSSKSAAVFRLSFDDKIILIACILQSQS